MSGVVADVARTLDVSSNGVLGERIDGDVLGKIESPRAAFADGAPVDSRPRSLRNGDVGLGVRAPVLVAPAAVLDHAVP